MSNLHPLEVVGRGSETQLQVGGNLNEIPSGKRFIRALHLVIPTSGEK